jgi:hypothetical protein
MTPLQHDPSAQAPWTSTMFGWLLTCHHPFFRVVEVPVSSGTARWRIA